MAFSESFLSNAGWLFFAAWSALLTAISIAAFDLLPRTDPAPNSQSSNPSAPHPHRSR